jgi:hypothetical protein
LGKDELAMASDILNLLNNYLLALNSEKGTNNDENVVFEISNIPTLFLVDLISIGYDPSKEG